MSLLLALKIFIGGLLIFLLIIIAGLMDLYSQLGRYKNYWDRHNKELSSSEEIDYVALGDSTAQAIGASHPSKGYVGLISKELEKRQHKPIKTINLSKSGAKLKDALETQLPTLQKLNTNEKTVVTIEIGANDMINFSAHEFESQMDELMSKLPPQTLITDMPYFGQSRFKSKQPNVEKANEIMYKLAAKHGFKLVPLNERMKQNGGIKTFAPDWFHPSNTAYKQNWAYVFINRL